ncbi:MAG TPA: phosphoglycerate mutase family protein [Acidimicrobiales bacterium]|nr:phosphoglycerate mutase family protein [Acidimicrobiales bacterium]|tara:strand:- start:1576 stop:2046 length:471 start_codon:yes stop_codon:yes gene_type:complete
MIYLVRHASAGGRYTFDRDDTDRPLDPQGVLQAEQLDMALRSRSIERILSSRAVRCQQSVAPLARFLNLEINIEPDLFEGSHFSATALIRKFLDHPSGVVACSHGDVIPEILGDLIKEGLQIKGGRSCGKGSIWALSSSSEGQILGSYYPSPLEIN